MSLLVVAVFDTLFGKNEKKKFQEQFRLNRKEYLGNLLRNV